MQMDKTMHDSLSILQQCGHYCPVYRISIYNVYNGTCSKLQFNKTKYINGLKCTNYIAVKFTCYEYPTNRALLSVWLTGPAQASIASPVVSHWDNELIIFVSPLVTKLLRKLEQKLWEYRLFFCSMEYHITLSPPPPHLFVQGQLRLT